MIINFRTFSFRNENHASQWPEEAVCGDSPLASPRIERQSHGEAAGMRCRDQLFRFGLRLSLEPTAEAVSVRGGAILSHGAAA